MIDEGTEFGARVARHLREEIVVWMTTVTPAGAPLPMPVWFVWDGAGSVVMYSRASPRIRNIEANPRVTLNYDEHIARIRMTPETFAEAYHVPVRIRLTKLRGD